MLLPLPTAKVRALSLENHLERSTVRSGRGYFDQICCLIRVVYLANFITDPFGNVTVGVLDKNGKIVIQPSSKIIGSPQ